MSTVINTPPEQSSYWWIGIAVFVLFIIAFIIVYVVINRNNTLDIVKSVPNYNIYYPKTQQYLNIINVIPPQTANIPTTGTISSGGDQNTPSLFWLPRVAVTANTDGMSLWEIIPLGTTSFDANTGGTGAPYNVNIVNTIYQNQSPLVLGKQQGYVTAQGVAPSPVDYAPNGIPSDATTFIYTPMPNNQFTLSLAEGVNNKIDIGANGRLTATTTNGIFQLSLISTN